MKKQYITSSPAQTKELAKKIAKEALKSKKVFVIGLEGDLGSGKTTFVQGFAKGLGIKEKILSPSFVIYRKFLIPNYQLSTIKYKLFYHFDCYRVQNPKEILDLGFKEIINNPQNIVVIEWADKIKKIMPKNTFWIKFKFIDEAKRKISLS